MQQLSVELQPILDLRPTDWLHLRTGGALAWATGPIGQRFYTYRAGGSPHNHNNAPTDGHYLGSEVDWTLSLGGNRAKIGKHRVGIPSLSVSGGHLFLGDDLAGGGIDRVDLYRAMLRTRM